MGILNRLRGDTDPRVDELSEALRQEQETALLLEESVADLELALEDTGWRSLAGTGQTEFSRGGLRMMAGLCRLMAVKNPLIKRGLNLRHYYVWGLGVTITARAAGRDRDNPSEQDVNTVVQAFLDDEGNQAALTGEQAHEENERALGTDGNLFVAHFTDPLTGYVRVRVLPFDEIDDVITNPGDKAEPWLYLRKWTTRQVDPVSLAVSTVMEEAYYPALGYRPKARAKVVGDRPVYWDAPVLHVRVNGQRGWTFGIPDAYAAVDWARAYKEFLEDWAKLVKALSRFAFRATAPGNKTRRAQIAARIAQAPSTNEITGEANDVGGTAVMRPDQTLEAIPKTGATIDSESGRPLAGMVAAGLDVPVTMLLADPGVTGARATAETLDRPTELMAGARRAVWTAALRRTLGYVVDEAVRAKKGPLTGTVTRDPYTNGEVITLDGDTEPTVDITWPDLDEIDVETMMKALDLADGMGKIPPLLIARLVLQALKVDDVDEILDELVDDNGDFVDPAVNAGMVAVGAFRAGVDPAAVLDGEPPAPPPVRESRPPAAEPLQPQPIHITVPLPDVQVHVEAAPPRTVRKTFTRDEQGQLTGSTEVELDS